MDLRKNINWLSIVLLPHQQGLLEARIFILRQITTNDHLIHINLNHLFMKSEGSLSFKIHPVKFFDKIIHIILILWFVFCLVNGIYISYDLLDLLQNILLLLYLKCFNLLLREGVLDRMILSSRWRCFVSVCLDGAVIIVEYVICIVEWIWGELIDLAFSLYLHFKHIGFFVLWKEYK